MTRYKHNFFVCIPLLIIFLLLTQWINFNTFVKKLRNFNNDSYPIPNVIHYIIFGKQTLDFPLYLSIASSVKYQNPFRIYMHSDMSQFKGSNWSKILKINSTNPVVFLEYMQRPTHVFGQPINSVYHASDVARILVLQKWGGIYLDSDVLILRNLDKFRRYEMVVGWPKNQYMGTQILLAQKSAKFLGAWLQGYKRYVPTKWYYNAGQYPTEQILMKMPHLAHTVPELFGVQNLLNELYNLTNWEEWKRFYAIHLLSRHFPEAPQQFNEAFIQRMNNTLKHIVDYILYS